MRLQEGSTVETGNGARHPLRGSLFEGELGNWDAGADRAHPDF